MNDSMFPFLPNADGHMEHPKVHLLADVLKGYDLSSTVAKIAGLATVPRFQANSYRVEILSIIAVACCAGTKRPTWQHLRTWLNRQLGTFEIACMEDPAEDVFVVNVLTPEGDFRVLGGLWEAGESATTLLFEALTTYGGKGQRAWLRPAIALLRLSDAMASRAGLHRWHMAPSAPKEEILIAPATPLDEWSKRVVFSSSELHDLGIDADDLSPFIFDLSARLNLLNQNNQESDLHRRPLLKFNDKYVLAIPTAVTYAARRFIVDRAAHFHQLPTLQAALAACAQRRVLQMVRRGSRHLMSGIAIPKDFQDMHGKFRSVVVRVGQHRFLHFVSQSDDLSQVLSTGFLSLNEPSASTSSGFEQHVNGVRDHIRANHEVRAGYTFWLPGVLGQAFVGNPPEERASWTFEVARLYDLEMLFRDPSDPADRLMLLLNQKNELEQQGLELPNHNGLLNLYAYWIQQGFHLRGSEVPHDQAAFVQIGIDYIARYRAERRVAVDEHCEITLSGNPTVVQRSNSESIYEAMLNVPAYVSLERLASGSLSFCIKHHCTTVWVTLLAPDLEGRNRRMVFELWEALQLLVHRSFSSTFLSLRSEKNVVEIVLDFSELAPEASAISDLTLDASLVVGQPENGSSISITCGPGFLRNFDGVTNQGEQTLLTAVLQALGRLIGTADAHQLDFSTEARKILGGTDARVLHTFRLWTDVEFLLAANPRPQYRSPREHIQSTIREAFSWKASTEKPTLLDIGASVQALNSAVTQQVKKLTASLAEFNCTALVRDLIQRHETLLREKHRWHTTARAVRGLYGVRDGTSAASDASQEYAQLQICLRALVEAAICESSYETGIIPDDFQIDELVGKMTTIIELGRSSDILYYGFSNDGIKLFSNGSYSLNAEPLAQITKPYVTESFSADYSKAADNYEAWAGKTEEPSMPAGESIFDSPAFQRAWKSEYFHSFDAFRAIARELQDLAAAQDSVVVEVAMKNVKPSPNNYSFTKEDVAAFVTAFGLLARPTWLAQPPESLPKEVNPWRFQRRLSLMLRPVVVLGAAEGQLIYGVGTLRESLAYVLDSISAATFDKDVFRSTEMRSFLGTCIDDLGREFTEHIAALLRQDGWNTKTELKLTQLMAPKLPNLGDIDVLAWRADGSVLVIECKRLKQSKTIAEIALACQRFAGNVGDHLHKHLRRAEWVKENLGQVAKFTKLDATTIQIRSPMVVSRPVPFKYLLGLPLPASEIVSAENLMVYLRVSTSAPTLS